jgi:hypothetical protein
MMCFGVDLNLRWFLVNFHTSEYRASLEGIEFWLRIFMLAKFSDQFCQAFNVAPRGSGEEFNQFFNEGFVDIERKLPGHHLPDHTAVCFVGRVIFNHGDAA